MVIVPSTGSAQTPVMPPLSSVSAFVTFTDAAPTENICQQTNGDHYVTMLDTKKVVKISPDGRITDFVIIPDAMFVIGVACGSNEIAVSIFTKDYRKPAGGLVFTDTGARLKFYDLAGKPKADVAAPANVAINGFDYAGDGIYCGGDSNSGTVFRIDSATHSLTPWFQDDSLAPTPKQAIGLYGVRAKNGWVYFSGPSKSGLFKVKIGANGQPEGGAIPMEPGLCVDDFDVAGDGSTFSPMAASFSKSPLTASSRRLPTRSPGGPRLSSATTTRPSTGQLAAAPLPNGQAGRHPLGDSSRTTKRKSARLLRWRRKCEHATQNAE